MALTTTQVSELYVAIFGRVSEGAGNKAWKDAGFSVEETAKKMLETEAAKEYFGSSLNSNESFVKHIYLHTLNKTQAEDPDGVKGWVDFLNNGKSREWVITELIKAAKDPIHKTLPSKKAHEFFLNKVALSDYTAEKVEGAGLKVSDLAPFKEALKKVDSTASSLEEAKKFVDTFAGISADTTSDWSSKPVNPGTTVELTVDTDIKTANVFNAGMKHNPEDRILTLQDEDVLTGDPMRADNTLNVTFGMKNADEGDDIVRTPKLKDIQNINIEVTGTINTLDLRDTNDAEKINIDRVTASASDKFTVQSIGQKLEGIRLADVAKKDINVTLTHKEGVLAGREDKTVIYLDDIADAKSLTVNSENTNEGYEIVNLVSKKNVKLHTLDIAQLKELTIKGGGLLNIVDVEADASGQFNKVDLSTGIKVGHFTKLDAKDFAGKLVLNINNLVGEQHDPLDSGKPLNTKLEGSKAGDVFYLGVNPGERTTIDAGDGEDKLILIKGGIDDYGDKAEKTLQNIEILELRAQDAGALDIAVNLDRFDDKLNTILVRNETVAADKSDFTISNITSKFAKEGKIIIEHDANSTANDTAITTKVIAQLKAKDNTDNDTLSFKVLNSKNLDATFEYEIDAAKVENLNIADDDTESNELTLTQGKDHKGTVTLTGGTKDLYYAVKGEVGAKVLDASAQKSNLRLTVKDQKDDLGKNIGQDIKLGTGNDVLTFSEFDGFDAKDKVTDAGGDDTARMVFEKDSVLNLKDIENAHIAANANVNIDVANTNISKLVIMSDKASGAADNDLVSGIGDGVGVYGMDKTIANANTKTITLKGTNISELNFFGDLDTDGKDKADGVLTDEETTQTFNAVTLEKNAAESLKVNINSSLDKISKGAQAYNIGKLTVHGTKNLTIAVADEDKDGSVTTFNNIFGHDLTELVVTASKDVNLNTVTSGEGVTLNNTVLTVNAEGVAGKFNAKVTGLTTDAKVKLGNGGNTFNADGSAGNNITIMSGTGNDTITGSAQSDNIIIKGGDNTVHALNGDNRISLGAGKDTVTSGNGADTVAFAEGVGESLEDNINSGGGDANSTTVVSKKFGDVAVKLDPNGDGTVDVDQWLLVASKAQELRVQWEGATVKQAQTVLSGTSTKALQDGANDADLNEMNANFFISDGSVALEATIEGKKGDDMVILFKGAKQTAIKFSGAEGNDTAVGGVGTDVFEGGLGKDMFAAQYKTSDVDGKQDTIKIGSGDSVLGSHDVIFGFDVKTAGATAIQNAAKKAGVAGRDTLDLAHNTVVAVVAGAVDVENVGAIKSLNVLANNKVAFASKDVYNPAEAVVINANNLQDAIAVLSKQYTGNETLVFEYDRDGDGTADSTILFQDGLKDTVVELAGLIASGVQTGGVAGVANDNIIHVL